MPHRNSLLLTGFEPFGGDPINSSWETARALDGAELPGGVKVRALQLPCRFGSALGALHDAIQNQQPRLVLALGQASNRRAVSLERVAVNLIDARIPDNDAVQPIDVPVVPGGPAAYFATLPLKPMLQALLAAGYPAELSCTAGSYVCNQVFYGLQHRLRRTVVPSGFLHLPSLSGPEPALPLERLVSGTQLALEVALRPPMAAAAGFSAGQIS